MNQTQTASKLYVSVLSVVLTVCSLLCFLSVFDLPCSPAIVIICSAVIPAALSYLSYSKAGKVLTMSLPILIAVYFAAAYQMIWTGYLTIANSMISKIDQFYHYGILTYNTGSVSDGSLTIAMAFIPLIVIFAYGIVVCMKHRLFVPVILLTFPFILISFYFHEYAALPAMVFIGIAWTVLFANSVSISRTKKSVSWRTTVWVLLLTAVFGSVAYLAFPYNRYTPSSKIDSIRQSIVNGIENLRYQFGAEKVPMDLLPNGDLKSAKSLSFTDEVVLQVTMEKPSAVYLKGYVGSVYADNRWNSLPPTAYGGDYMGLFEWLAKSGFYPQSQMASLQNVSPGASNSGLSVKNIALESKIVYAPYEAIPEGELSPGKVNYKKDAGIFSKVLTGTRSYSFSMVTPLSTDYGTADFSQWIKDNIINSNEYSQYIKEEMAYRAFVYANYLNVPVKTEKALETYFTKETIDSLKNQDYQSVIKYLRKVYLQDLTYSTEIDALPADSDFIENFLKTGSGYDVHFATLSVMLLRSAGIPARYVEGYYLPRSYVDIYSETVNPTLDVKDSFAHAWAEIYVDSIGWIPAELTPGYYTADKDASKDTGSDENITSKDKNYYNDQENALTNDSEEEQPTEKRSINLLYFEVVSALVILVALIIAVIFIIKAKRKKGFSQPDKTKAALEMFGYVARLIRFGGIKIDRRSAYASSEEISRKYDPLTEMSFAKFLDLVYKARFSPTEPDGAELIYMQNYSKSLAKQIYVQQGLGKKIFLIISGLF